MEIRPPRTFLLSNGCALAFWLGLGLATAREEPGASRCTPNV